MNVLLIGSGGREHALAWALSASPLLDKLYCAPGNGGIADVAECAALDIADRAALTRFCKDKGVEFVVVGPEGPLVEGIVDDLEAEGLRAFGPSKAAARLEGSKGFTKDLCAANGIPTAAFRRFDDPMLARDHVRAHGAPIVVKADGLAAGKGVAVCDTVEQAEAAIEMCFGGRYGEAGAEVVVEERLRGEEASYFALVDGEHVLPLATAQDHKRAYDADLGPNTGGMGAYSPAPAMTPELARRTLDEIVRPTVRAMARMGTPFKGVLYAGLMLTPEGPKLIEYNVRFGDPETQVLMPRLKSDLLPALLASRDGQLAHFDLRWKDDVALTVVMAAKGYPGAHEKGSVIDGLWDAAADPKVLVFHAGTERRGGQIVATGGRVLNVTALGQTVREAQARAYAAIDRIVWPQGFCRTDIGWRAIAHEAAE